MIKGNDSINKKIYLFILKIFIVLCVTLLIIPLSNAEHKIKKVREIRPEGFVLKKIDSHYEPVEDYYKSFLLPGTEIKVGVFSYINKEGDDTGRLGFLIGNNEFFFVHGYDCMCNDVTYNIYKNYLLIDGGALGSAGAHDTHMHLFKYNKNSVKLLDTINLPFDFFSYRSNDRKYIKHKRKDPPMWILSDANEIKIGFHGALRECCYFAKYDDDEKTKIKNKKYLKECEYFKNEDECELYLKIINDRLHIDYDSRLYNNKFESIKTKYKGKPKPFSYYLYGYLTKKLSLQKIKSMLINNQFRDDSIEMLKEVYKWDSVLHEDERDFKLTRYELRRE